MATRYGHQPIILIGKEASYGAEQKISTWKIFDNFSCSDNIQTLNYPQKTLAREAKKSETHSGYKNPTVTISGIVTDHHDFLIKGWTGDDATPHVMADTTSSYTIYHAFPAAEDDAGDGTKCLGCVLESIEFGTDGGFITYTANFRAKSIDREADLSTVDDATVTNFSFVERVPFKFVDITCSLIGASTTKMDTFTLSLTKEFLDDAANNQNAEAKTADNYCKSGGSLSATYTYDITNDATVFDYLYDQTDIYDDVISFVNDNATWAITTKGQYQTYDLPDIDRCKYKATFTKALVGDADEVALSIAVS